MRTIRMFAAVLAIAAIGAATVDAQGKGKDKDRGGQKGGRNDGRNDGRKGGNDVAKSDRGNDDKGKDNRGRGNAGGERRGSDRRIQVQEFGGAVEGMTFRAFAASPKKGRSIVGKAISRASNRGIGDEAFVIRPVDGRVFVLNRTGDVLVDWDDDRELGNWRTVTTPFRDKKGAPSFCRSGAGHPVWGRQWCVDKGFGLGVDDDLRWSRVLEPRDIVFTRPTTGDLTRDVLVSVLGDVVLNRLATHAITLGLQDPLSGRWLGDASETGPRVLLLSSGARPIAELVDVNRDDKVEVLVVAVRP
jgi:hypothetical protein